MGYCVYDLLIQVDELPLLGGQMKGLLKVSYLVSGLSGVVINLIDMLSEILIFPIDSDSFNQVQCFSEHIQVFFSSACLLVIELN